MEQKEFSKEKKDVMPHLIKKENSEIRKSFLKKMTLENQATKIRKSFLKKMTLEKQASKTRKKNLVIQITLNTLTESQMSLLKIQKKILLLNLRKNLKIEKDLKIFHSKSLKTKDKITRPLNDLTNFLILTF